MQLEELVRRATSALSEADRVVAEHLRSLADTFREAADEYDQRRAAPVDVTPLFEVIDPPDDPFITVKQTKHIYALLREVGDMVGVNYSAEREAKIELYKTLLNNPFITSTKDLSEPQAERLITMLEAVVRWEKGVARA